MAEVKINQVYKKIATNKAKRFVIGQNNLKTNRSNILKSKNNSFNLYGRPARMQYHHKLSFFDEMFLYFKKVESLIKTKSTKLKKQ